MAPKKPNVEKHVWVVVVVRILCLYDVSVQATQHEHPILGARRLGTSPGRLRHPTSALVAGAPSHVLVHRALPKLAARLRSKLTHHQVSLLWRESAKSRSV